MKIYKTRVFHRWADDEGLTDTSICAAVKEMKDGLFDADLGGGLFKKRIAKQGKGKSGGFRTLLATNRGDSGFLSLISQKMNVVISIKTKKKR